ncbi:MAG: hypothetical protein K1000chlam1_00244 [Candidatus Anoxychlamydiales bacterium]|nr:hypothetical protein [Candidatus Anoxychlamydiales bacterium]
MDLSDSSQTATEQQITTDCSGRYVYAVWRRIDDGTGENVIQTNFSSDFGITWENPNTTPTGLPPDLSDSSRDAYEPQIIIDSLGRYVYAIWRRIDAGTGKATIQTANGYKTFYPIKNLSISRN